jgi:AraC family transcriptional regulator
LKTITAQEVGPVNLTNISTDFYGTSASCAGAGLTLSESIYPAGLKMSSHLHEPAYFSLVLKGAYTETFGEGARTCVPSTMIFHPPNEKHAVDFHNAEVRIFRVEVEPRWLERTRDYSTLPERSAEFRGGFLSSLCARLYGEFHLSDACSVLAIEGLMLEIIAEISRGQTSKLDRNIPGWLELAREILRESLSEPPSLEALAGTVGVHPVYLARQFRRRYHCTIGEYLRQLRIEAACREMRDAQAPLSVVAANAGFYDQSHFANTFKRYTGMTPTQYRAVARLARPRRSS